MFYIIDTNENASYQPALANRKKSTYWLMTPFPLKQDKRSTNGRCAFHLTFRNLRTHGRCYSADTCIPIQPPTSLHSRRKRRDPCLQVPVVPAQSNENPNCLQFQGLLVKTN